MHRRAFLVTSAIGGVALAVRPGAALAQIADTRLVCVDAQTGADGGSGTQQAPVRTLAAATALLLSTPSVVPDATRPLTAHLSFGGRCWLTVDGVSAGSTVAVIDAEQQIVLSGTAEGETLMLSASSLEPGFYVVRSGNQSVRIAVTP